MAISEPVPAQPLVAGPRPRRVQLRLQDVVPYLLLVALVIGVVALEPNLLKTPLTFVNWLGRVTDSSMSLILVVIGQTMVILTGGIDLSVGGIISLTNSLAATQFGHGGTPMLLWMAVIVAIGLLAGAINGFIVAYLRVQPFIATLATWSIWGGLAHAVLETDGGSVPDSLLRAATGAIGGIPKSMLVVLLVIGGWLIFKRIRFATQVYAIGSSAKASYLSGTNVARTTVLVYTISGLFAALAGIYRTIDVTSGSPLAGDPFILNSVAAVVIGGTSLAGGRGGILGPIAGVFILKLIPDVIQFAGVSNYNESIVQGLLLIAMVTLYSIADYARRRRRTV